MPSFSATSRLLVAIGAAVAAQLSPATSPTLALNGLPRPPSQPQPQAGRPDPATPDLRTLLDPDAPAAERERVARRLLAAADSPRERETLQALLSPTPDKASGGAVVLSVLASLPSAPPSLFPALSRLTLQAPEDRLPEILPALGSFRTRDSARLLLRYGSKSRPEPVRTSAFQSLARLSGLDDLGPDLAAWESWLAASERQTETQWQASLTDALAARADALAEQRQAAGAHLVESLRRLHLATKPDERSALLASLLQDDLPEVRALGFELAARELSASRRLGPEVGDAALELLAHPSPQVRENAAILVNQLSPPEAAPAVLAALAAETNPKTAAALLNASLRWPSVALAREVLHWLELGTAASGAASDAAWALYRAGLLSDPGAGRRVLAALRTLPVRQLTPAGCRLLADLGDDDDRAALASLLDHDSQALRVATGEALAGYPEFLGPLILAAALEPQLFDPAVRAVVMAGPDAGTYRAVAKLPTDSPETRRRSLLMVAGALPAPELLLVARETADDPPLREALLTSLGSVDRILSEQADPRKRRAIAEGLLLLAQARIDLGRPDAAVSALDELTDLGEDPVPDLARLLRATAMLRLNRLEDALALDAPPEIWVDALEAVITRPFARDISAAIEAHFIDRLSSYQIERLARLRAALPPAPVDVSDVDFVGPLQPGR